MFYIISVSLSNSNTLIRPRSVIVACLTCLFVELISNEIFNLNDIDIDAKYHCRRYGTIIWQYGTFKISDGAIYESEVTETIASKFGGPHIEKKRLRTPLTILLQDQKNQLPDKESAHILLSFVLFSI